MAVERAEKHVAAAGVRSIIKEKHARLVIIMLGSTEHANTRSKRHSDSLGYDFALLGLSVSESRVDIIREAAGKTAARIQRVFNDDVLDADQMLSELASSTYRLLDPRRRTKSRERIQLSIVSEQDFELQKGSRVPLIRFKAQEKASSVSSSVVA